MDDLTQGVAQFQRDVFSRKVDLFAHLTANHGLSSARPGIWCPPTATMPTG
jgi:hypothetical protein